MIKILNIEATPTVKGRLPELTERLNEVLIALDSMINSEVFRKEFLKLKMVPKVRQSDGTYKVLNLTNQDMLNALESVPMAFNVRFYENESKVLGMTHEEENKMSLNTFHFRRTIGNIASTIYHEYLHIFLNLDHDGSKDFDSVPYAAGHLVKLLFTRYEYEKGKQLRTVNRGFPVCFLKVTKWVS